MPLFLGIDIGTSGVRTSVINAQKREVAAARVEMKAPDKVDGRAVQDPWIWDRAVNDCLEQQAGRLADAGLSIRDIVALAVDGTSGTLMLADKNLDPVTLGLMYNSGNFFSEAEVIAQVAPSDSIALGPSSALARLLFAQKLPDAKHAAFVFHQADWIAAKLLGQGGSSDENNVLKLGYDLQSTCWPEWLGQTGVRTELLPAVHPVGDTLGRINPLMATRYGFSQNTHIVAGTTDGNAAFLASGASEIGEASTSLGTTLAIKLISHQPVTCPKRGVYSHRLFGRWLAGGASNTGGGALLSHFSREEIKTLQSQLCPFDDTGLDYYPLAGIGERFPINDPHLQSRVTPRPESDARFLQGLLEGIARVERSAYDTLCELGGPPVRSVTTTGGGALSDSWTKIRQRILNCPVSVARADAAFGTALVAHRSSH
ncbi:MAG: FGGY-family carbohydrate kinase [Rhodobacteraceae bacterium]|nr:FGGY-family carbohydrate kinase [Paracoccaceae bacterium]